MLKQVSDFKGWILFSRDVVLAGQACQLHGELQEVFRPLGKLKKTAW